MSNKNEFLELLYLNQNLELKDWLIKHGKASKPYAAVMFEKDNDAESMKNQQDKK